MKDQIGIEEMIVISQIIDDAGNRPLAIKNISKVTGLSLSDSMAIVSRIMEIDSLAPSWSKKR